MKRARLIDLTGDDKGVEIVLPEEIRDISRLCEDKYPADAPEILVKDKRTIGAGGVEFTVWRDPEWNFTYWCPHTSMVKLLNRETDDYKWVWYLQTIDVEKTDVNNVTTHERVPPF